MCHLHYLECVSLQAEEWRGEEVLIAFFMVWIIHVAKLWFFLSRVGVKLYLLWPVTHSCVLLIQLGKGAGWWQVWKKSCLKRKYIIGTTARRQALNIVLMFTSDFEGGFCVRPGLRNEVLWVGPERRRRAGGGLFLVRWTSKKFSLSIQSSPGNRLQMKLPMLL